MSSRWHEDCECLELLIHKLMELNSFNFNFISIHVCTSQRWDDDGQERSDTIRSSGDEIFSSFARQEFVRMLSLAQAVKKKRQVMFVV